MAIDTSADDVHRTAPIEVGRLTVRTHADVVAVAHDAETFSNAVSRHLQIPNGLDGPRHAAARRVLDPFFAESEIAALEPAVTRIARDLVADLAARDGSFDAVADLGARFAVRAQSEWLGWRGDLEDELLQWVDDNRSASRSRDPVRTAEVARRFDDIIRSLLDERRPAPAAEKPVPKDDVTSRLMALHTEDGRALDDTQIVSVLRNWTGGDLSSIALCAGVVMHWLAVHPEHQAHLATASGTELDAAIDEILRIDDPFVSNRRVATRDTEVAGCPVAAGDVITLSWRDANRDPARFGDADRFDPDGNAPANVVYGTGPHVCPGRPLATRELRVLARAVLAVGRVELDADQPVVREEPPVAGFRTVFVRIVPHADQGGTS